MYNFGETVSFHIVDNNLYLYNPNFTGNWNDNLTCLKTQFDDNGIYKVFDDEIKPNMVTAYLTRFISKLDVSDSSFSSIEGHPDEYVSYKYIGKISISGKINLQTGKYEYMKLDGNDVPQWLIEMIHTNQFETTLSNLFYKNFPNYKSAMKIS